MRFKSGIMSAIIATFKGAIVLLPKEYVTAGYELATMTTHTHIKCRRDENGLPTDERIIDEVVRACEEHGIKMTFHLEVRYCRQ